ncbi:MAG TPA: hypothetical protein VFE50_21745 [Cyclobacteriaceae bacterium]|nr:hypothetical protein [Cyclobacteriaceae bacterium]
MKKLVWFVVFAIFTVECATEDFKPGSEEQCKVGRYVFAQENGTDRGYEISYVQNTFTRVEVAVDQIFKNGQWLVNDTYRHIYSNDSIYIKEFNGFREGATLLSGLYKDKIQEVTTNIADNGGVYRFRFDYSTTQRIAVTLEKVVGNSSEFDSRAVYYINNKADVERVEIFKNPDKYNGPNDFTYRDIKFTYDEIQNPIRDLVISHFFKAELPDVTYFSMHNRLEETYDGTTRKYTYEYGTDPMPKKVTTPDGVTLKFEYPNCTN